MRRVGDITVTTDDRPNAGRKTGRTAKPASRRAVPPPAWRRPAKKAATAALALAALAGVPVWAWQSGWVARTSERIYAQALSATADAGLKVDEIYIEGRTRTSPEHILAALKLRRGDPILGVDLKVAKARLEALSWVRTAVVERRLPGSIYLHITERDPIALWQNQGRFVLVDRDGRQIDDSVEAFAHLPLVVGEDAPRHAAELIAILGSQPGMMTRVKAAVRVGNRRWNLKLDDINGGIDVRLPEEEPADAWKRLADLDREHALLARKVTMIDLRLPDRLVLRTNPEDAPMPIAGKKKPAPGKDA